MKCGLAACSNIWTDCPVERCFAFDIHKHEFGECWLKWQSVNHTHSKDPHEGHKTYPTIMRRAPRKIWPWAVASLIWTGPPADAARAVPWTSRAAGVLALPPAPAIVGAARRADDKRAAAPKFACDKHAEDT